MGSQSDNIRKERVERLLKQLRYEIGHGMIEGDLEEQMEFKFYVPVSKDIPGGVVFCEFCTRPIPRHMMSPEDFQPRLSVVK